MSDLINENQNKKQRLGRGIGSLLGGASAFESTPIVQQQNTIPNPTTTSMQPAVNEQRVWNIAIEKLTPSPFQPRINFEKSKIDELASSIKQSGILQPIVARKLNNGSFEIIAGERRWRAAQVAGLKEVPTILKTFSHKETLEMAIVENIQREDLNPIEEAMAFQRLIAEFNLTQQAVADKVGKERASVTNSLRLLQLPNSVQELIIQNQITMGHAKVLLSVDSVEKITELAKKIIEKHLSVRLLEKEIQQLKTKSESAQEVVSEDLVTRTVNDIAEELQKKLGTKVVINYRSGKGSLNIHFYSDDELTQITEKVRSGCQN